MKDPDYKYEFTSFDDLKKFVENRKNDTIAHYWYGDIDNFDEDFDTIADIQKAMEPSWFTDGNASTVYVWDVCYRLYILEESLDHGEVIQMETTPMYDLLTACSTAGKWWDHLAESDKKKKRISVILARPDLYSENDGADLSEWTTVSSWE